MKNTVHKRFRWFSLIQRFHLLIFIKLLKYWFLFDIYKLLLLLIYLDLIYFIFSAFYYSFSSYSLIIKLMSLSSFCFLGAFGLKKIDIAFFCLKWSERLVFNFYNLFKFYRLMLLWSEFSISTAILLIGTVSGN